MRDEEVWIVLPVMCLCIASNWPPAPRPSTVRSKSWPSVSRTASSAPMLWFTTARPGVGSPSRPTRTITWPASWYSRNACDRYGCDSTNRPIRSRRSRAGDQAPGQGEHTPPGPRRPNTPAPDQALQRKHRTRPAIAHFDRAPRRRSRDRFGERNRPNDQPSPQRGRRRRGPAIQENSAREGRGSWPQP